MQTPLLENPEEPVEETPEDVAVLFSWANLHGAKYRDFSASRREYRAQVRHRAAEELRRAELAAKEHAEAAAAEAERAARAAEEQARSNDPRNSAIERERAQRAAGEAARLAAAERVEAARRAEAAAVAEAIARREEREIAEAHASAQRQAKSYSTSESRRRYLAGPQPSAILPGQAGDPYETVHTDAPVVEHTFRQPKYDRGDDASKLRYRDEFASRITGERRVYRPDMDVRRRPQGYVPDDASGVLGVYRPGAAEAAPVPVRERITNPPADAPAATLPYGGQGLYPLSSAPVPTPSDVAAAQRGERGLPEDQTGPAWLYASTPAQNYAPASAGDTLQQSRERLASRWFALKGAFEPGQEPVVEPAPVLRKEIPTPVLGVFSLAGGVGKTSLVATLGRALSSLGEKVLLADTTSHGLLPYYFGASELRPGVVRTFSPPSGSTDAPIHLVSYDVSYDVDKGTGHAALQDAMMGKLAQSAAGTHRILLDLNSSSGWIIRRLSGMKPTILVPVAADMNSVISLQTMERYFQDTLDNEGRPLQPFYVLNQFDASLPLHLDVREVLGRQLGERLLPFAIRRAPAVSEALAEGMTVVDYAPEAQIAGDYANIAGWLRNLSPPVTQGFRNIRWSER